MYSYHNILRKWKMLCNSWQVCKKVPFMGKQNFPSKKKEARYQQCLENRNANSTTISVQMKNKDKEILILNSTRIIFVFAAVSFPVLFFFHPKEGKEKKLMNRHIVWSNQGLQKKKKKIC